MYKYISARADTNIDTDTHADTDIDTDRNTNNSIDEDTDTDTNTNTNNRYTPPYIHAQSLNHTLPHSPTGPKKKEIEFQNVHLPNK